MTQTVTKAIIPCGGKATRFAPISRTVPKEMLPIKDKPAIHYIIKELIDAGITDILMLIGTDRGSLQHYADGFNDQVNIYYRRVPVARGTADNIWHAKSFIGHESFIIAYCDDIFFDGNPSIELIEDFNKNKSPVITTFGVPLENAGNYGIAINGKIIEKPKPEAISTTETTCQAAVGRYLLSPRIFSFIEQEMPANDEAEICFTKQLNKFENLRTVKTAAKRFDTGTPQGLYKANQFIFDKEFIN